MSSPLPQKRKRLEDATRQLKKPFVSPLRRDNTNGTGSKENKNKANLATTPYTPSTLAHTISPNQLSHVRAHSLRKSAVSTPKSSPVRKQTIFSTSARKTAPEELALQKDITALELRIRKVQNDLDLLKQARQIVSSSQSAELEALTSKWRLASQAVAEELFGTVKERVCRMGGVAAWRETEKRKYDRSHGLGDFAREEEPADNDADCEFDSQGEELPEDEQEYRKKLKRTAQREAMEAADIQDSDRSDSIEQKPNVWQEGGEDDDTFTIDMMLRSLNIDLSVIGYDKQLQRWMA